MTTSLRIAFMGTPDFAVPCLQALIEGPDEVVGVFTNPDRRSGRGKTTTPPPVKVAALASGLRDDQIFQPHTAKRGPFAEQLTGLDADLAIVVAYGQILPQRVLDIPRLGCINVHASALPKLRGAAPINWAIVRGHTETGISIMQMEAGLDSGPVYHTERLQIMQGETAGELHDRLMGLGAEALMKTLVQIRAGEARAEVQDHDQMTYAPMMKKADGQIDWSAPAQAIVARVLGFNPWPGAFTTVLDTDSAKHRGTRIKLHRAEVWEGDLPESPDATPGTVLSEISDGAPLLIKTGEGTVRITRCQAPGRRALVAEEFLRGCPLPRGSRLGSP